MSAKRGEKVKEAEVIAGKCKGIKKVNKCRDANVTTGRLYK